VSNCEARQLEPTDPAASRTIKTRIAIIAHDKKKGEIIEWAHSNREALASHELIATGTTGTLIEQALSLPVGKVLSGPLGGDLQIGAAIAKDRIDLVVFFWGPLEAQPHDPNVRALLRVAVVWNIPVACNRATADFIISSPLMASQCGRSSPDYQNCLVRAP